MADTDLKIAVTTTADLTGLNAVDQKVKTMNQSIADQLSAAGAYFDPITKKFKTVADESQNAATAVKVTSTEIGNLGVNMNKAVGEATTLARELATGSFQARTLGALLGALGPAMTAVAIAGFVVHSIIKSIGEEARKVRDELEKENEALLKQAAHWQQIADATKGADISGLTRSFASSLDEVNNKISALVTKANDVSGFRRGMVTTLEEMAKQAAIFGDVWAGLANLIKPSVDEQLVAMDKVRKEMLLIQTQAIEMAHATQGSILALGGFGDESEKVLPLEQNLARVTAQTRFLREQQEQLDTTTQQGMERFIALEEQIRKNEAVEKAITDTKKLLEEQTKKLSAAVDEEMKQWEKDQTALENFNAAMERAIDLHTRLLSQDVSRMVKADEDRMDRQIEFERRINTEAAIKRATGDEELTIQEKVKKIRSDTFAEAQKLGFADEKAAQLADTAAESARHDLEVKQAAGPAQNILNEALTRYNTILQGIRQQQQLIGGAPFMGVDAKQAALLASYTRELQNVQRAMLDLQRVRGGLTDPEELNRADQEMQKLAFHAQELKQNIAGLTQPLRAEMTSWANSFGTTAHQIASTIQGTINASLQTFNQYLVTGKFNAQQLLQQIFLLGVQLLEQMAIQRVMALINQTAAVSSAAVTGPAIAAAFAPAATAVTIATEGQAALSAPAEYAAALLAIQALAVAHEGGRIGALKRRHAGGLASDEELVVAQHGEYMVQRDVAQRPGIMGFLAALNAGMLFHSGGLIRRMHRGGNPDISGWQDPAMLNQDVAPWSELWPGNTAIGLHRYYYNVGKPSLPIAQTFRSIISQGGYAYDREQVLGNFMNRLLNFGYLPSSGFAPGGPTIIPTQWVQYPGVGAVPMALPWTPTTQDSPRSIMFPSVHAKHRGGMIGVRSFHGGGSVGGSLRSGSVNVHNYTDLKALVKEMATRKGRNIIVDTVRGRKIDLGMR